MTTPRMPATPGSRSLADCTVTLGITGGIAAYKTAELVREMRRMGLGVQVVMTEAAQLLVSPHALATLSERPVVTHLFHPLLLRADHEPSANISHIQLSRTADMFVVAPATANVLAKVAAGVADDVLTTAIVASNIPVLFAPAMNVEMWGDPIVQDNVDKLRAAGYHFVGPEAGDLACGETGSGRMSSPHGILDAALPLILQRTGGRRVLITAGPTEEPIDEVRVLSNRSSGKMGVALAAAARDRGHRVTLVAGPLRCPIPPGIAHVPVTTAANMLRAVEAHEEGAEILIMAAAVADYRTRDAAPGKLPSKQDALRLALVRTPDILATVAPRRRARGAVTVGFALEVGDEGEARARRKLAEKGLDMIVLNDATRPESAFGADTTRILLLVGDGAFEPLPVQSKAAAAQAILKRAESILRRPGEPASEGRSDVEPAGRPPE